MKTALKCLIIPIVFVLLALMLAVGVSAKELDLGIPVEEYPELFISRTMPTHGDGKVAVFLIEFTDYKNDKPGATAEYYNKLYFSDQPLDDNIAGNPWYGSVATFYEEESFGKLKLSGKVFGWYAAKHERSYYDSTWRKTELIMEAIAYYESTGVDFSQFDGDGDGVIDAVVFHFAGPADTEMWEPWYGGVEYSMYVGQTGSGKTINSFIQIDNSIDTSDGRYSEKLRRKICHELMHTLGMYDLYGTSWFGLEPVDDLMTGNYNTINPYYKILLGWTKKVTLVTSDTLDIKLRLWKDTGETILVTDSYNGIFDELYLIAYTKYNAYSDSEIRIWHVDARLDEAGTAFLYSNLTYSPRPDQADPHGIEQDYSEYLFMEEVSPNPFYDYVLNISGKFYFEEGASLAPNSIPSTDTHDGRHTGIKIDDFKRFDGYASMDITFGHKDKTAPKVSDELSSIGLAEKNQLRFNEYIYPSDNWSKIKITTLSGETVPAKIVRNHYSAHEIEIVISAEIPKEGYLIVLPDGCVRDSSGNKNKAQTISVTSEGYVFEQSRTFLPWYYEGQTRRWEDICYCFSYGTESIVITSTGEGMNRAAFIEFLKTDASGNITTHKFINNPYPELVFNCVLQAADGSYIIPLHDYDNQPYDSVICIDKDGNLRWYKKTELTFSECAAAYKDGIMFFDNGHRNLGKAVFVNALDGTVTPISVGASMANFNDVCCNGKDFVGVNRLFGDTNLNLYVRDSATLALKQTVKIELKEISDCMDMKIAYNSNGTYTVVLYASNAKSGRSEFVALKLNSSFKVTKKVTLDVKPTEGSMSKIMLYPDDGFSIAVCISPGNHSNTTYKAVRLDKNLNLIWQTNIETQVAAFFVTSANEICAFSSYWSPKREAYLLRYGSEEKFESVSHDLTHHSAISANCTREGQIEHWTCSECGDYFSDANGKNMITAASVVIAKTAHIPKAYDTIAATCTKDGSSGGTYCKSCNTVLTPKTVIPATGHTEVKDAAVTPTYDSEGLTEGSHCSTCGAVIVAQEKVGRLTDEITAAVETTKAPETITASPETTTAPESTAAPVTTKTPESTTASPETTKTPESTAAPVTAEPAKSTESAEQVPAQTTDFDASGVMIAVIAAVSLGAVLVTVVILCKKRK